MSGPLLEISNLTIQYSTPDGLVTAVSDASLQLDTSEFVGLVGESGSGKSTLAKSIIGGLDANGRITRGEIYFEDIPVHELSSDERATELKWSEVAYVPQGSMNSLDPLERISDQAYRIAKTHTDLSKREALDRFEEMFELMGLPVDRISDYPHQFSGGMQQRAIIALALFLEPSLLIADEPTTALDVIMQDQIFRYLERVKGELDTSMLLITHDVSVVFELCESMGVMHSGQLCESGTTEEIFDDPRHPYTILLQEAFPDIRHPNRRLPTISGHPPVVTGDVTYCTFVDRCPWAIDECAASAPPLDPIRASKPLSAETGHRASCFRSEEVHELHEAEQRDNHVEREGEGADA